MSTFIIPVFINNDSRPNSFKQRQRLPDGVEVDLEVHTREEAIAADHFNEIRTATGSTVLEQKDSDDIHWLAVPFVAALIGVFVWVMLMVGYFVLDAAAIVPPMYRVTLWDLHPMTAFVRIALAVTVAATLYEWFDMFRNRKRKVNP